MEQSHPIPYIDTATLLHQFTGYSRPHDAIRRMEMSGKLLRLKRGIYLTTATEGEEIPFPQIANFLHGPSYLSLEWALSYYNLIPEGVETITSITTKRRKEYITPIGTFSYEPLNTNRYRVGIDWVKTKYGGFFIALPEKAILDYVHVRKKHFRSLNEFYDYLRIDEEDFSNLNWLLMEKYSKLYKSKYVSNFVSFL